MKIIWTLAFVAALATARTAAAQDVLFQTGGQAGAPDVLFQTAVPPPPLGTPGDVIVFGPAQTAPVGATFERRIDVLGVEPLDLADTVTGAPYTADIVTETVQTLADGNRIERQTKSSVARDSEGRVRREQQVTAIGPIVPQQELKIVMIVDPVAKVNYSLDEKNRIATRMPAPILTKFEAGVRVDGPQGGGVSVTRAQGGVAISGTASAAGSTMVFMNAAPQDERTEPLGKMQIEGVTVDGTRTTVTIPAGAIGNQAPIEIVSERWYSPELRAVVSSRRFDPRFGETIYRLENIVRAEPAAELFKVPEDYTVRTTMGITMKP